MIRRKTAGKLIAGLFLSIFTALMLTCGAELSRGETTDDLPRIVKELVSQENPYTTLVGQVVSGGVVFSSEGRAATALRIHPMGTSLLFVDTGIAFCGDITDQITTPDGRILQADLAFTYRRRAGRLIDGVPCYELQSIMTVTKRGRK